MKIIRPAQVTQAGSFTRNSIGTYFDANGIMQVAVANALRITYDPTNLTKAPYALIEPTSTNLLLNSGDMSVQSRGANMFYVGTTDGPGGQTGFRFSSMANGNSYVSQSFATTVGSTYTFSYWLRLPSGLASGTFYVKDNNGTITFPIVVANTANWQRVSVSFVATSGAIVCHIGSVDSPAGYTFDVAMAMFETGSVATSYIPTTASSVTRAADVIGSSGLLYSNVPETDYPTWSATIGYVKGDRVLDVVNHKVYESLTGLKNAVTIPASSTVMSMLDANNAAIIPAAGTAVKLSSTGTLPSGFNATATYYVVAPTATGFSLSATAGGTAISSGTAGTGTYTLVTQVNLNKPINDILNWVYVGLDNRWTMFDQSITSQSVNPGSTVIAFSPGQRMDSVVGLNCAGSRATVSMVDANTGKVVYCTTVKLSSNSGITDWYSYFFEPVIQLSDFVLDDLPIGVSSGCVITVAVVAAQTAKVGGLVFGLSKEIGLTEWGTKVSIVDYSVKTQDSFGNYTITPRAFSKKADFTVQVPTDTVDFLHDIMSQYRSTPVVYIGYNGGGRTKFSSTVIYGYYKDFSIDIAYNAFSVCSLTVEGLT